MTQRKRTKETSKGGSKRLSSLADEDIVTHPISRRSALATLGIPISVGAIGVLLGSCVATGVDADPYDGLSSGGGYNQPSGGGRQRDIKLGDGSDYPVYADFQDLDANARDTSDHGRTRSADRSSANDYD